MCHIYVCVCFVYFRYFPPELIPPPEEGRRVEALVDGRQYHSSIDAWSIGIILMEQIEPMYQLITKCDNVLDQLYMIFHYLYPEKFDMSRHFTNVKKAHESMAIALSRVRHGFMIQMLRQEYEEADLMRQSRDDLDDIADQRSMKDAELIPMLARLKPADRQRYEAAFAEEMRKLRNSKSAESTVRSILDGLHVDSSELGAREVITLEPKVNALRDRVKALTKYLESCQKKPFVASAVAVPQLVKLVSIAPGDRLWFMSTRYLASRRNRSKSKYIQYAMALFMNVFRSLSTEVIVKMAALFIFLVIYYIV